MLYKLQVKIGGMKIRLPHTVILSWIYQNNNDDDDDYDDDDDNNFYFEGGTSTSYHPKCFLQQLNFLNIIIIYLSHRVLRLFSSNFQDNPVSFQELVEHPNMKVFHVECYLDGLSKFTKFYKFI